MRSPYRPKPEKTYVIRHKKHDAFTDAKWLAKGDGIPKWINSKYGEDTLRLAHEDAVATVEWLKSINPYHEYEIVELVEEKGIT
jgi:hypothetical protein